MNDTLLGVETLSKRFGGVEAVAGVSFHVRRGEIYSLIGPNGAGKTTTFNMISGVVKPSSGTVHFDGRDITGMPVMSRPSKCTVPLLGLTTPLIMLKVVVLPAPLGPIRE